MDQFCAYTIRTYINIAAERKHNANCEQIKSLKFLNFMFVVDAINQALEQ